jgi:hypothetical protein
VNLSVTQVAASALATVVGAVLASRLGVYGTIAGATVMSVLSTSGSALFTHLFNRTGDQLKTLAERNAPAPRPSGQWPGDRGSDKRGVPQAGSGAPRSGPVGDELSALAPPPTETLPPVRRVGPAEAVEPTREQSRQPEPARASTRPLARPSGFDPDRPHTMPIIASSGDPGGSGAQAPDEQPTAESKPATDADAGSEGGAEPESEAATAVQGSVPAGFRGGDPTARTEVLSGAGSGVEPEAGADDAAEVGSDVDFRDEAGTAVSGMPDAPDAVPGEALPREDGESVRTYRSRVGWRPKNWKVAVLAPLLVFALSMGTITVVELITDKPISATVRGEDGSGTTLGGGHDSSPSSPSPGPTTPAGTGETGGTSGGTSSPTGGGEPSSGASAGSTGGSGSTGGTGGTGGGTTSSSPSAEPTGGGDTSTPSAGSTGASGGASDSGDSVQNPSPDAGGQGAAG